MIWMDVDIALSEVPVNSVPLVSDSDFKTVDEGIAYNESGMALYWHFTTTAGATSVTAVTPTTSGLHDWTHQDHGIYTIEIPTSSGDINNTEEGFGYFTGIADAVLPFRGPTIGFRAAALNNSLVDGTDALATEAKQDIIDGIVDDLKASLLMQRTTIAALNTQVSFALSVGSTDDGAYKDRLIIIEDASTAAQKAIGICESYTGSSKTIVLYSDPGIFTMAVSDIVTILSSVDTQSILNTLAGVAGGLAVRQTAESSDITNGDEGTTSYEDTISHGGDSWELTDAGAGVGIDAYLEFDIGGDNAIPVDFHFHGYFADQAAANKSLNIQVRNWHTSAWDTIHTLMKASSAEEYDLPLTINNVGTVATDPGIVRIRFVQSATESGNVLYVDHCDIGFVTSLQTDSSGYVQLAADAIGSSQLATTAVTEIVTAIFGKTGLTATGTITFGEIIKMLNARAHLNFVKSGSDLLFYDDDWVSAGSPGTLLFTVTVAEGSGITVVDA